MAELNPELKPLRPNQRQFIHLMVYQGLERVEAYAQANDKVISDENYVLSASDVVDGQVKLSQGKKKHGLIKVA